MNADMYNLLAAFLYFFDRLYDLVAIGAVMSFDHGAELSVGQRFGYIAKQMVVMQAAVAINKQA